MQEMTHPLRYFSYSRDAKDSECPRARYLGSEWGETGLDAVGAAWERTYGNILHKYLEKHAIGAGFGYDEVRLHTLNMAKETGLDAVASRDWAAIAEGHVRGFIKYVWPHILAEYEILETEKLRVWQCHEEHTFRYRQDILLKNKHNGRIRYIDYKSTSTDDPKWIASWSKHPQLHSSMYAMQKQGVPVDEAEVIGFYKGYKDRRMNTQRSILAYGWVNREFSMLPEYSYEYKRGKGWELFSTYEEFPDLYSWIDKMPLEILSAQFIRTGPIFPNDLIGEAYFRQKLIREKNVGKSIELLGLCTDISGIRDVLDEYFPQNFNKCEPAWGFPCEYRPICWQPWVAADPIGSKLFVRRNTDHISEVAE